MQTKAGKVHVAGLRRSVQDSKNILDLLHVLWVDLLAVGLVEKAAEGPRAGICGSLAEHITRTVSHYNPSVGVSGVKLVVGKSK